LMLPTSKRPVSAWPTRPPSIRPRLTVLLASAAAGLGGLAATAAPASALSLYTPTGAECTIGTLPGVLDVGPALTDALGYQYDTTSSVFALIGGLPVQYATLAYGSSSTAVPGRTIVNAWDDWGDLFVGATESRATQYLDADPLGCERQVSGRQVAFATTTIGGLKVQRSLFVPATGVSAARLVESVRNPSSSPVTTSVWVGDVTSNLHLGSLGADAGTTIGQTSSGDTVVDATDRWAVTGDDDGSTPALAHVWDGPGGDLHASVARSGAQTGSASIDTGHHLDPDQFGYGWQNVTIPAGGTASFLSWELMRGAAGSVAVRTAAQNAAAASAASDLSTAPSSTIYEGMTAAQIASVRNWAKPAVDATLAPVDGATSTADTTLRATAVDFGSTTLSQCSTGSVHWDFGDGSSATGLGGAHRFAAGEAHVTVTVAGDCGGTATKQLDFHVDAPTIEGAGTSTGGLTTGAPTDGAPTDGGSTTGEGTAPATPVATPAGEVLAQSAKSDPPPATTDATALVLTALPKIPATQIAKKGVDATVQSSTGGSVRFVLTGTGIKYVKTVVLKPGPPQTTTLRFPPSAGKVLKVVKTLQLRAKLTLPSGQEIISTRPITVHH
ncbi:MAG: PKD domain-containing protein, partial [Solirubrobacteraceae bacterium]|nr:PKD domain-containing protein [Patulibacter sp.]